MSLDSLCLRSTIKPVVISATSYSPQMHDVLERTCLHARVGEQALASHALERINTCAYAYAERLHAMCLNDSVNAYVHTLSFWYLVVYTEQRGRPGWITIPATPWKNTSAKEQTERISTWTRIWLFPSDGASSPSHSLGPPARPVRIFFRVPKLTTV